MTQPEQTPIPPIPSLIVEKNRYIKEKNIVGFLSQLKPVAEIRKIYYPGPGFDDSLTLVFKPEDLSQVDRTPYFEGVQRGSFSRTPQFKDEEFDAIFLQDAHQKPQDFQEFLRVLKQGGIVIQSLYGCGNDTARDTMSLSEVLSHPALRQRTLLPNWDHLFLTLEHIRFQR